MDWKWNYGQGVLVLPASTLEASSDPTQLRVLLWLASDASLAEKPLQLAKLADCTAAEAKNALQFWCEAGVLSLAEASVAKSATRTKSATATQESAPAVTPAKKPRLEQTPQYTTAELADMMEEREALRRLIDAASGVLGKVIQKVSDVRILAAFVDYYGFEEEYVLLLLKYCKEKRGKATLGWIEKFALGLRDDYGIETAEALEKWIRNDERVHSLEGKVRHMFGIKDRELVSGEKRFLVAWAEYGYNEDIVRLAYEITVQSIQEPSMAYANSILERWHAEGLKTATEISKRIELERAERAAKASAKASAKTKQTLGNSFDTDDFFEAALKRSFGDSGEQA